MSGWRLFAGCLQRSSAGNGTFAASVARGGDPGSDAARFARTGIGFVSPVDTRSNRPAADGRTRAIALSGSSAAHSFALAHARSGAANSVALSGSSAAHSFAHAHAGSSATNPVALAHARSGATNPVALAHARSGAAYSITHADDDPHAYSITHADSDAGGRATRDVRRDSGTGSIRPQEPR